MTYKILIGLALLIQLVLPSEQSWAIDETKQSDREVERSIRQREGGRAVLPSEEQTAEQGATEDGLPPSGVESLDRRERMVRPGWRLGVYAYNTPTGAVIARVVPGSPAAREGFEPGDRIVDVSGYQVGIVGNQVYYLGEELQRRADRRGNVLLLCQNVRNGQLLNINVRLESRRFAEPAEDFPRDERLGTPRESDRP